MTQHELPAGWPERWAEATWTTLDVTWNQDVLLEVYRAIETQADPYAAKQPVGIVERAVQLLRKADLVWYDKPTKSWRIAG